MADVSEPGDLHMAISFVEISQLYKATPPHPHTPPRPPHSFWIPETAPCLCSFLPNMGQHWLPLICSLYGSPVSHLEPTSPSCLEPNRVSLLCSSEAFEKQTPGQDSVSKYGKNHNPKKPRLVGGGGQTMEGSILDYCTIQKRFGKADGDSQAKVTHQRIPMSPRIGCLILAGLWPWLGTVWKSSDGFQRTHTPPCL